MKEAEIVPGHRLDIFVQPRFLAVVLVFGVVPAFLVVLLALVFSLHWILWLVCEAVTLWAGIQTVRNALVKIPAYHYGVPQHFKKRTAQIWLEGMHARIPFVETIQDVSMELRTTVIGGKGNGPGVLGGIEFTTKDKVHMICEGSLQYRADPGAVDRDGLNVFITMSRETIDEGVKDAIEAKLGALGGVYTSDEFIELRHSIGDFLDASLRLKTLPHEGHVPNDSEKCGLNNCTFPSAVNSGGIDDTQILAFYKAHWKLAKDLMRKEKDEVNERSRTEERYGIDIETFALATVSFTKETQDSLEKERQAKARKAAFEAKMEMARRVKEILPDASAQVALNAADVSLDPSVDKKVVSVEGEAGVLGALVSGLTKGGKS